MAIHALFYSALFIIGAYFSPFTKHCIQYIINQPYIYGVFFGLIFVIIVANILHITHRYLQYIRYRMPQFKNIHGIIPLTLKKAFYSPELDLKYFEKLSPTIHDCLHVMHKMHSSNIEQVYILLEKNIIHYDCAYWFIEKAIAFSLHHKDFKKSQQMIMKYQEYMLSSKEYDFYKACHYTAFGIEYKKIEIHDARIFGSLQGADCDTLISAWKYSPNRHIFDFVDKENIAAFLKKIPNSYEKNIFIAKNDKLEKRKKALENAYAISPTQEVISMMADDNIYIDNDCAVTNPSWICYECYVNHKEWDLICSDCMGLNTIIWDKESAIANPLNAILGNAKFWATQKKK